MRKLLLSLGVAAVVLPASADKIAFVAANGEEFYDGDAKTVVVIPDGFYFATPNAAEDAPAKKIAKGISSDIVMIESTTEKINGEAAKANKCFITSGCLRWYTNQGLKFTPAKGITLKTLKVRTQRVDDSAKSIPGNYLYNIVGGASDTRFEYPGLGENPALDELKKADKVYAVVDLNTDKPIALKATGQLRCFYIEIEYEGTPTSVALPTCSAKLPVVKADEEITLACATEGANIFYTLDGSVPTAESTKYTAPFKLDKDVVLRAVAVKGEETSFPYYGEFFCLPAGVEIAEYNLSDWQTLTKKDGSKFAEADFVPAKEGTTAPHNMYIDMNGVELKSGNAIVKFEGETAQLFRSWTFGNVVEYRPNSAGTFSVSVAEGNELSNILVIGSSLCASPKLEVAADQQGTAALSPVCSSYYMWSAGDANGVKSINYTGGKYIDKIYVATKSNAGSGVAGIEADGNAPVEYYNLQGIRVANPENGLYIVKQGNKVTKRIIK